MPSQEAWRRLHYFARYSASLKLVNWPGAAKANAEWFPSKERAFAQGIFNSGAAIGGIISIPLIAFLERLFWLESDLYL